MATLKRTTSAIQNFITSMNKSGGYARTSKYAVVITPPTSLAQLASERIEPVVEGGRFEQGFPSSPANPNASTMQSLYKQLGQQVNLHCNTVSMPGHDLQAQDMKHGSAPGRQIVTSHDYAGTINASFYLDSHMRERHFFEMWQKMAVSTTTHKTLRGPRGALILCKEKYAKDIEHQITEGEVKDAMVWIFEEIFGIPASADSDLYKNK